MTTIVDLSMIMDPENTIDRRYNAKDLLKLLEIDPWIFFEDGTIVEDITMFSHIGTHIEAPYHQPDIVDRTTIGEVEIHKLVGEASIIDLSYVGTYANSTEIYERCGFASGVLVHKNDLFRFDKMLQKDDIVIFRSKLGEKDKPVIDTDAASWLFEKGVKCVGVNESHVFMTRSAHRFLLENGVPIIEGLDNLYALEKDRVFIVALPLRILHAGSSPARVIAIT